MNEFERGLVRYMGEDKLKKIQRLKVGMPERGVWVPTAHSVL